MKNSQKSFETPKGCLSCSEKASEFRIKRVGPHGTTFLNLGLHLSKTLYFGYVRNSDSIEKK